MKTKTLKQKTPKQKPSRRYARKNATDQYGQKIPKKVPREDDDDYKTPESLKYRLLKHLIELIGWNEDEVIDLCCNEKNMQYKRGLAIQGSIGITPRLVGSSLKHAWHKFSKFGWLAVPYTTELQKAFVKKAVEEAAKGMIIVAKIQANVSEHWFKQYVHRNPNCVYFILETHVHYPGQPQSSGYATAIVIFGVNRTEMMSKITEEREIEIETICAIHGGQDGHVKLGKKTWVGQNYKKTKIDTAGTYQIFSVHSFNPETNDPVEQKQFHANSQIRSGEFYEVEITENEAIINGISYDFDFLKEYFYIEPITTIKPKYVPEEEEVFFIECRKTNRYDDFHYLDFNRLGNEQNIKEDTTKKEINAFNRRKKVYGDAFDILGGYDYYSPVICALIDGTKYICDGQGRVAECKDRGIKFSYFIHPNITTFEDARRFVQVINSSQKRWTIGDWMSASPNAGWYKKNQMLYPCFTDSVLALVGKGQNCHKRQNFQNGFDFENILPHSDDILRLLSEIRPKLSVFGPNINKNFFILAICNIRRDKKYNKTVEKKLLNFIPQLTLQPNAKVYEEVLREACEL